MPQPTARPGVGHGAEQPAGARRARLEDDGVTTLGGVTAGRAAELDVQDATVGRGYLEKRPLHRAPRGHAVWRRRISTRPSRSRVSNAGWGAVAGPRLTEPSRRSNREPWQAQTISSPSTSPSLSEQPRCEHRSWMAYRRVPSRTSR